MYCIFQQQACSWFLIYIKFNKNTLKSIVKVAIDMTYLVPGDFSSQEKF